MRPWAHGGLLDALGRPGIARLGQPTAIEFGGKDQGFPQPPRLIDQADPSQAFHPVRVVVFRHQLGQFPSPADCVEPVLQGLGRDREALFACSVAASVAQFQRVRYHIGAGGSFEQRHERPGGKPALGVVL